jgi:Mn2+/Fe2+ NRAMP family transporter
MCARLGAYTGEGLGSLIREQFSIRVSAFALLAFVVANLGLVVSEFAGIAAALNLVGVSRYVSIPVAAVAIWALVVFGSYRYAERLFLILSLAFLSYPVAAVLAHPDVSEVASQTFLPHLVASRDFLLLTVALIGTTITPYMQFYIAGAVADKGVGPAEYRAERIDTVGGAIFANLIQLLINAQLLNGIITPILLSYVLILANRKRVLGDAVNGRIYRVIAAACVAVVAIMAAAALTATVLGWFGVS